MDLFFIATDACTDVIVEVRTCVVVDVFLAKNEVVEKSVVLSLCSLMDPFEQLVTTGSFTDRVVITEEFITVEGLVAERSSATICKPCMPADNQFDSYTCTYVRIIAG